MAEGVMRRLATREAGRTSLEIASAGTHDYHVGRPPFPSAVEVAKRRGYDITACIARRVTPADLDHFDAILAMDRANLAALRAIAPTRCKPKIELLLEYGDRFHGMEVPDPYGGTLEDFERALDMIEDGCRGVAALAMRQS
jgi:low molecular weight protein-tyrosine phosphatase